VKRPPGLGGWRLRDQPFVPSRRHFSMRSSHVVLDQVEVAFDDQRPPELASLQVELDLAVGASQGRPDRGSGRHRQDRAAAPVRDWLQDRPRADRQGRGGRGRSDLGVVEQLVRTAGTPRPAAPASAASATPSGPNPLRAADLLDLLGRCSSAARAAGGGGGGGRPATGSPPPCRPCRSRPSRPRSLTPRWDRLTVTPATPKAASASPCAGTRPQSRRPYGKRA
jgi:hypothetical protein